MQPRKLAAVLAAMDPVTAQELTVELATGDKLPDNIGAPAAGKAPDATAPTSAPSAPGLPPQAGLPASPAAPAPGPAGKQA
jgi:hypothetical protein